MCIINEPMRAQAAKSSPVDHIVAIAAQRPSEGELIERSKIDPEAFAKLYEKNYDRILNYIYRLTLNITVTEELTSNTFFKALCALSKFRPRTPIEAWLYRIASNEVKTYWRLNRRRRQIGRVLFAENVLGQIYFNSSEPETKAELREKMKRYAILHGAINSLPDRYQRVLVLRYFEELKVEQIAKVLGKRIGTVKSLIHRGLARLRKMIQKESATFPESSHP